MENPALYFDLWPMLDAPDRFPFITPVVSREDLTILKNLIGENMLVYDVWAAENHAEILKYIDVEKGKRIGVNIYTHDQASAAGLLSQTGFSCNPIETSVIFEGKNSRTDTVEECEIPHGCTVQKAEESDIAFLDTIRENSAKGQYYIQTIKEIMPNANRGSDDENSIYVLRHENSPVSYLVLASVSSTLYKRHYKHICVVYTVPASRLQGMAGMLVNEVKRLYSGTDFLYITDSLENTASLKLARKTEFAEIGYNCCFEITKT